MLCKFKTKRGIFIIQITKDEAKYLHSLGFRYSNHVNSYEADLHHTQNKRHRTYYCAEKKDVLKALSTYRKKNVVKKYYERNRYNGKKN